MERNRKSEGDRKPRTKQTRNKIRKKQGEVSAALREQIVSNAYPPGSKIPTQLDLMRDFGKSSVTIQRALQVLKNQGFLTARRKLGTFVSENPPHLSNFALVFPQRPLSSPIWSNFYESLRNQAVLLGKEIGKNIEPFYGLDDFERSPDHHRLLSLVENRQLAGIIFAAPPLGYAGSPLTKGCIPKVMLASAASQDLGLPIIQMEMRPVLVSCVKHFVASRRLRIGFFGAAPEQLDEWLRVSAEFSNQGITTREIWCFCISPLMPSTAATCARLLMELPESQRPNAFIVADDHLTESVERGLTMALGSAASDIAVVARCNLPDQFGHTLPIQRIGVYTIDLLRRAVEVIELQRRGKNPPRVSHVDPVMV